MTHLADVSRRNRWQFDRESGLRSQRVLRFTSATAKRLRSLLVRVVRSTVLDRTLRVIFGNRIPHYGNRIWLDPSIKEPHATIILLRLYERLEVSLVRRYLPRNLNVVELGGSLGVNTCNIARLNPNRVISVEAIPFLAQQIRKTAELNNLRNIHVVNAAISYSGPTARFQMGHSSRSGKADSTSHEAIDVPAISLSALLDQHGIEEYALVADIEGAEAEILQHDAEALTRCKLLIVELHDTSTASKDSMAKTLQGLGFRTLQQRGSCIAAARGP